ncbi:hypothetical protein ACFE04_013423 [Oxalis oulophora]
MNNNNSHREEPSNGFHTVHAERDLEANWEVDLAQKLEDYLLKICSGEITGTQDEANVVSINFAEAALLLQGSVQVYSRKVEYLYNLVLHALEFLSQKRQQDQSESSQAQHEGEASNAAGEEEGDLFWGLDDIPVESKTSLDSSASKDVNLNHFVKPPANLVVLEGDCLDTGGDGGELESYLLATNDLYQDFILLDPCDAISINDFTKGNDRQNSHRGGSARKSFLSPSKHSGGSALKSSLRKSQDANLNKSPGDFENNYFNPGPDNPPPDNFEDKDGGFMDDGVSEPNDLNDSEEEEEDDDPWKPLNPHEPGNLKVKPFKKVKVRRNGIIYSTKRNPTTALFPPARPDDTVSPEFAEIWETRRNAFENPSQSQYPPLYEKLRQSLTNEAVEPSNIFGNPEDDLEDNDYGGGGFPDFDIPGEIPENMDEDLPAPNEKHDHGASYFDANEAGFEDPSSQASLEDLCRSHLDALLASIAETEKQTELAARVSSWKQKIEHNLDEQDSRPPFDIHEYGERVLDKLSESDNGNVMAFTDVVRGQEKHDIARTFSALLQLVNNGDVELDKCGVQNETFCYTSTNPFRVQLLSNGKRQEKMQFRLSKKRVKTPSRKRQNSARKKVPMENELAPQNCKISANTGKINGSICNPDSKRRRRCRIVETVDI